MFNKTKIIRKEQLHQGYLSVAKYDLQVPSLNEKKAARIVREQEIVNTSDSVLVLVYVPKSDSFVLCREFRPGVFLNHAKDDPFILQGVAGTIENHERPEETAHKEVYEETGLEIKTLQPIAAVYKSPGILTEKAYLYYAEITGSPKSGFYGVGNEEIKTVIINRKEVFSLMDEFKILDSATLLALTWFRVQKNG